MISVKAVLKGYERGDFPEQFVRECLENAPIDELAQIRSDGIDSVPGVYLYAKELNLNSVEKTTLIEHCLEKYNPRKAVGAQADEAVVEVSDEMKAHFMTLYSAALSDLNLDASEINALYSIAKKRGINADSLFRIFSSPVALPEVIPTYLSQSLSRLYDLSQIIVADGKVTESEIHVFHTLSNSLAIPKDHQDDIRIRFIDHAMRGSSYNEVLDEFLQDDEWNEVFREIVLHCLKSSPGQTAKELSRNTEIGLSSLAILIDHMVSQALVLRKSDDKYAVNRALMWSDPNTDPTSLLEGVKRRYRKVVNWKDKIIGQNSPESSPLEGEARRVALYRRESETEGGRRKLSNVTFKSKPLDSHAPFVSRRLGSHYEITVNSNHAASKLMKPLLERSDDDVGVNDGYYLLTSLMMAWTEYVDSLSESRRDDSVEVSERWGRELRSVLSQLSGGSD